MATITVMTGIAGAGKSTYARSVSLKDPSVRYIAIDDFYKAVFGNETEHYHKYDVWEMCLHAVELAARDGVDVILDTNAPRVTDRNILLDRVGTLFDRRYLVYVDADPALCRLNNASRSRVIPEKDMNKLIANYEKPTLEELGSATSGWSDIYQITNVNNKLGQVKKMFDIEVK